MKSIIYISILMLLCIPAIAAEIPTANTTGSVIVSYPDDMLQNVTVNTASQVAVQYASKEVNVSTIGRRISQGECVVPGETIDIAGIGWYTGTISYYGKYYDDYTEENNVSIKAVYHPQGKELSHLYLDPQFFGSRLGYWYTMYDVSGGSGNDRLFKVSLSCNTTPKENITERITEYNITTALIAFAKNKTMLPVKTETNVNYIFSRPSITTLDTNTDAVSRWIFGMSNPDTFYDTLVVNGSDTFDVRNLAPGIYDVVYIAPGKNGILEETFNNKSKAITSPFKYQHDTPIYGILPKVAETLLGYAIKDSKDDIQYNNVIDVQDPRIDIIRLEQNSVTVGNTNVTAFTISGYTNANQGTTVNIQLDDDVSVSGRLAAAPYTANVINNGGQVAYRAWTKTFLLDTGTLSKGQHYFTVTNKEGATSTIPFYVRQELATHYVPDATLNYISNSPFIPTPTPQVIEKPVIVTQTVEVPVTITPSPKEIEDAAKVIVTQNDNKTRSIILECVVGLIIACLFFWVVVSLRRVKQ